MNAPKDINNMRMKLDTSYREIHQKMHNGNNVNLV